MTDDSYCKTKETALPSWMNEPEEVLPVPDRQGGRTHFLRRTMLELGSALEQELHNENMSKRDGVLQGIDARLKIAAVLMAVLLTALVHDIYILLVLYGLNILLMIVSRLPAWTLQKRIWLTIPLLTLLLALPATLNLFNDGIPLLVICTLPGQLGNWQAPEQLFISYQGARSALFIFLRVGLSVSWGVLLIATTPFSRLLSALHSFKIPPIIIMVLEMSIRYLALLLQLSLDMFAARQLRSVGQLSLRERQQQVGSAVGALFVSSILLSQEIHEAMVARCYTGANKVLTVDEFQGNPLTAYQK
jgi:cobalt/nickel transport system permease protein